LYTFTGCKPEKPKAAGSQNFFFCRASIVGRMRQNDPGARPCSPVRVLSAFFWQLTLDPAGNTHPVDTQGVDKPMHIHRSECAETPTMKAVRNLYTFGASAIQALFSTSASA
jgi:hypothetical protein